MAKKSKAKSTSEPSIPFEFDPGADEYEEHHLVFEKLPAGQSVTWPLAGATFHVPDYQWYPDFGEIEKVNGKIVKFHGLSGFSVGSYHELLVGELQRQVCFRMGKVEVSFGLASPLMAYLFDGHHEERYFGTWQDISTARILGVNQDEMEIAFINAAIRYGDSFGVVPRIAALDTSFLEEDEKDEKAKVVTQSPPIRDIDTMRFFYNGMLQSDNAAACIYFYRVLEYYSFLTNKKQMSGLRHNTSIGDDEFARQILQLVTRDEKGPLLKLINDIADEKLLKQALAAGFIKAASTSLLGEAIYGFRNSIVHGKDIQGHQLESNSALVKNDALSIWRAILRTLANRAIQSFGRKLL